MSKFWCDDKFQNVIDSLIKRGWNRDNGINMPSPECKFIWKNLAGLKFGMIFSRLVNHLKGTQHLSNKAFFAYHLDASKSIQNARFPPTWSASYQTLPQLLLFLCLNGLACTIEQLLKLHEDEEQKQKHKIEIIKKEVEIYDNIMKCVLASSDGVEEAVFHVPNSNIISSSLSGLGLDRIMLSQLQSLLILVIQAMEVEHHCTTRVQFINEQLDMNPEIRQIYRSLTSASGYGCSNIFIVKPVGSSCGTGILLARGIIDTMEVVNQMQYKCVVQRYIERPLLVRGRRKFDIRQWVLITSLHPLVIRGCSEFYIRLCSEEYTLADETLNSKKHHLSNHAVQSIDANIISNNDISDNHNGSSKDDDCFICDSMMTYSEFKAFIDGIEEKDHSSSTSYNTSSSRVRVSAFTRIKQDIIDSCVASIKAVQHKLTRIGRGFEWLGFDLMLAETSNDINDSNHSHNDDEVDVCRLEVKLIECNVSPDVSYSTAVTSPLVQAATDALMEVVIDTDDEKCKSSHAGGGHGVCWEVWYDERDDDSINRSSSNSSISSAPVLPFCGESPWTYDQPMECETIWDQARKKVITPTSYVGLEFEVCLTGYRYVLRDFVHYSALLKVGKTISLVNECNNASFNNEISNINMINSIPDYKKWQEWQSDAATFQESQWWLKSDSASFGAKIELCYITSGSARLVIPSISSVGKPDDEKIVEIAAGQWVCFHQGFHCRWEVRGHICKRFTYIYDDHDKNGCNDDHDERQVVHKQNVEEDEDEEEDEL